MTKDARATALEILERRELTEAELRTKLTSRDFGSAAVEAAVAEARSCRWVDDRRVAEATTENASRDGRGPEWLRARLTKRGIAGAVVDEMLAAETDDDSVAPHGRHGCQGFLDAAENRSNKA